MFYKLLISLQLLLLSVSGYSATKYLIECKGGGDMVTVYGHSVNTHTIHLKFNWAQDQFAEPAAGFCRFVDPTGNLPWPVIIRHRKKHDFGYGVQFTMNSTKDSALFLGPDIDPITRYLLSRSFKPYQIKLCVTYEQFSSSIVIGNAQYVKGFVVRGFPQGNSCN